MGIAWDDETVISLKAYAKALRSKGYSGFNKSELISFLQTRLFRDLFPKFKGQLLVSVSLCTCSANNKKCRCRLRNLVSALEIVGRLPVPATLPIPLSVEIPTMAQRGTSPNIASAVSSAPPSTKVTSPLTTWLAEKSAKRLPDPIVSALDNTTLGDRSRPAPATKAPTSTPNVSIQPPDPTTHSAAETISMPPLPPEEESRRGKARVQTIKDPFTVDRTVSSSTESLGSFVMPSPESGKNYASRPFFTKALSPKIPLDQQRPQKLTQTKQTPSKPQRTPSDDSLQISFRRLILNPVAWARLRRVDLVEVRGAFTGSVSSVSSKAALVQDIVDRCIILLETYPQRIIRAVEPMRRMHDLYALETIDEDKYHTILIQVPQILLDAGAQRGSPSKGKPSDPHPKASISGTQNATTWNEDFASDMTILRDHLNINNLSSRRHEVISYRHGLDLYSLQPAHTFDRPEVDHIVERQFVSYAMISAGIVRSHCMTSGFALPIREVVNHVHNLNVTHATINNSKGKAFTTFLREEQHSGSPRPLPVILLSDTQGKERAVARYTDNVVRVFGETVPQIVSEVFQCRRGDRFVSATADYEAVAAQIEALYLHTGVAEYLDDHKGVRTRQQKREQPESPPYTSPF